LMPVLSVRCFVLQTGMPQPILTFERAIISIIKAFNL